MMCWVRLDPKTPNTDDDGDDGDESPQPHKKKSLTENGQADRLAIVRHFASRNLLFHTFSKKQSCKVDSV